MKQTSLTIQSSRFPYSVKTGLSLSEIVANHQDEFFLVDSIIWKLYQDQFSLIQSLVGKRVLLIDATEEQKSYGKIELIIQKLIESGMKRNRTLVVIGGGVTQDIGCFISSILFRGVRWVFVPTTLLAQCDSCIGSKSSINLGPYKNQLGTFYPPQEIFQNTALLKTLPHSEILSGIGEIIKVHLLAGDEDAKSLQQTLSSIRIEDPMSEQAWEVLTRLIWKSLEIKKTFIEKDEFDQNIRNLLNLGHTFGHGFESVSNFEIPHGIAVTLGILTSSYFSEQLEMSPRGSFQNLKSSLARYYRPYDEVATKLNLDDLISALGKDKKNTATTSLTCILTRGPGRMEKKTLDMTTQVKPLLEKFFSEISK